MEADMPDYTPGYLYLVHAEGTPRYKLGRSGLVEGRLSQLQGQSPYPLKLLGFYEHHDSIGQERRLHAIASEFRVFGEWFELPPHWLDNLEHWFYATDRAEATIKRLIDPAFAEELKEGRRHRRQLIRFSAQEVTPEELEEVLAGLTQSEALEIDTLLEKLKVAMNRTQQIKGASKVLTRYREVCFRLGVFLPGNLAEFNSLLKPFRQRVLLVRRMRNGTLSLDEVQQLGKWAPDTDDEEAA